MVAGLLAVGGCGSGHVDGAGDDDGSTGAAEGSEGSEGESGGEDPDADVVPTGARYWRLTWGQYDRAVSDLVGRDVQPSVDLGFPRELEGFAGWLNQSDSLEVADGIATAIEDGAVTYAPEIAASLPRCAADDAGCIDDLVRSFGARAWRRPLLEEEAARYYGLFGDVADELDEVAATESVVEAMLRSPYFVFRSEVGDETEGDHVELTPHEIASALSFSIWGAPPDAKLLAAAEDGSLADPDEIVAQAQRLLDDPRFLQEFYPFVSQWLGFYDVASVTKDATLYPEWDPSTAAAMKAETHGFLGELLTRDPLTYQDLLTANFSLPPAELEWIYGIQTDGSKIQTPKRQGILLQPSFLATHAGASGTSPTKRGVFVVRRATCFEPPLPPDDLVAMNPEPDPNATTRELFERHSQDPGCASCHVFFDPVGMAFENFDAVGRYRETENGLPVDPSAELAAGVLGPKKVQLEDAVDLAQKLADSPFAQECFVRKAFQYFHGREDVESDEPLLTHATQAFTDSSFDIRALMLAFVERPEFTLRKAAN